MTQVNFDVDQVVADARAVDGLSDFGDDSYREPLEKLAWSLEHEAQPPLQLSALAQPASAVGLALTFAGCEGIALPDALPVEALERPPRSATGAPAWRVDGTTFER